MPANGCCDRPVVYLSATASVCCNTRITAVEPQKSRMTALGRVRKFADFDSSRSRPCGNAWDERLFWPIRIRSPCSLKDWLTYPEPTFNAITPVPLVP